MFELQTGDLILTHSTGFRSWLIQWVQRSYWNHALLVDEPIMDDWAIMESIAKGPAIGLLKERYSKEIVRGDIAVFRYYRPLTEEEKQKVRFCARQFELHHYDKCLIFRLISKLGVIGSIRAIVRMRQGKDVFLPHISDKYIICSEFFQEIFARAMLPVWPSEKLFLPRSAYRSDKLIEVCNDDELG